MSKNGSIKEFLFSLILKMNPSLINPIIQGEFLFKELEKRGLYIDVYGLEKKRNLPVYFENQLTVSNPLHYNQVREIIDQINEGIVIWIAERFIDKYVEDIYHYLHFEVAKPIDFYAVIFNQDYVDQLSKLNQLTQYEAWHYISNDLIELPKLTLFEKVEIIPKNYIGQGIEKDIEANLTTITGRNKYLMEKLKERVPYLLNLHRSRKLNNRIISIGAGKSDIDFKISVKDRTGRSFIKIRIAKGRYQPLIDELEVAIKTSTYLSDLNFKIEQGGITHFINPNLELKQRIDEIVNAFEKIVYVTAPITYRKDVS